MIHDYSWTCGKCGRHMTPSGDCTSCNRIERKRAEDAGERKRGKNIIVGDIIYSPVSMFKFGPTITVDSVKITSKGRVIINEGRGYISGEVSVWGEQWVDMVKPKESSKP